MKKNLTKLPVAGLATLLLVFCVSARADIIVLETWNVADIQSTGDSVEIIVGTMLVDGLEVTTLSFQWQEGDTSD